MTKYQEYYKKMVEANKELFEEFRKVHDDYALNPDNFQEKFNEVGAKIQEVMLDWENKLCMQSEKGGFSVFTAGLAEKFKDAVRKDFPEIDSIGLVVSYTPIPNSFNLKKIKLS